MTLEETPAHPPGGSRLEKLPFHQLTYICEWLVEYEPTTKKSLGAFALASKTCCSAADPQRFRQMNLFLRGPRKMHRDIQSWRQALEAGDRMAFVRVIKISGSTLSAEGEERETKAGRDPDKMRRLMKPVRLPWQREGDEEEERPKLLSGLNTLPSPLVGSGRPTTQWLDEKPWQPLVQLIKELPLLQDVVFESRTPFPRCLLSELHDDHPQARLHMHRFGLPSLVHSELDEQAINSDDLALATSPCLFSIVAVTSPYAAPQVVDYHEEAIMDIANGLAPRLKNVCIVGAVHQASNIARSTIPRPPWKGFPPSLVGPDRQQLSKGRLENLNLSFSIGAEKLLQWSRRVDFSQLRSLALTCEAGISTIAQLTQISCQSPLKALSSLQLYATERFSATEGNRDVDLAVAELLQTLSPLEDLMIVGLVGEQSFDAIIAHHAEKLLQLEFHSSAMSHVPRFAVSPMRADQLSQRCRQLEELELQVARTQGDQDEVAIYRCLARLPRLKRLTLNLKTIPLQDGLGDGANRVLVLPGLPLSDDEDDDGDDGFPTISDTTASTGRATIPMLQDAFKTAALDSTLALSIFHLLGRDNNLRVLRLSPYGFRTTDPIGSWLCWLSREWIVRREAGSDVKIREVGLEERQGALEDLRQGAGDAEWRRCKKAWDGVWPPRSEQWWDEWSSVPLNQG